jgi:hypothetical protein
VVAFQDVDEFLVLKRHRHVVDFLHYHAPAGLRSINCYVFGSSKRLAYEPLPVAHETLSASTHGGESSCNVDCEAGRYGHGRKGEHSHFFRVKEGKHQLDTNGKLFTEPGPFNEEGPIDVVAVIHQSLSFRVAGRIYSEEDERTRIR